MKKKKIIILLVILVPTVLILFFIIRTFINTEKDTNTGKTFLQPYIASSRAEIFSIEQQRSRMNVKLLLVNHMPIDIKGEKLQYTLTVDGVQIIKNHSDTSFNLHGSDSTWIYLPMDILSKDFRTVIQKNERKKIDSVDYILNVSFLSNLFFNKKISLEYKRKLPLFHFPDMDAKILQIDSLNFSRASLQMVVNIKNHNLFPIRTKNISYKFSIENHEWLNGKIPGLTVINAKSDKHFFLPIKITFKKDTRALFRLLKRGEKLRYKLDLVLTLISKNNFVSDTKVIYHLSGTVKSLKNSDKK